VDVYVAHVDSPVGTWTLEGTAEALTAVHLPDRHFPAPPSSASLPDLLNDAVRQCREYFRRERRSFSLSLAPVRASAFQRDVWRVITEIPYGQVRTYAEVAALAGRPGAARAVGNAAHVNPFALVVPCHRVVAANGLGGYAGEEEIKRYLLGLEGSIDLARDGHRRAERVKESARTLREGRALGVA